MNTIELTDEEMGMVAAGLMVAAGSMFETAKRLGEIGNWSVLEHERGSLAEKAKAWITLRRTKFSAREGDEK